MNREDTLKTAFNDFWNNSLCTSSEDYYSRLSLRSIVDLKKAISCINNILTLKVTVGFIELIQNLGIITLTEANEIKESILSKSANANGYDIEFTRKGHSIIAEVKCNIPVTEHNFGAAQIASIKKDLDGLIHAELKKKSCITDTSDYFKFMVLLETENVRESMSKLAKNYCFPMQELPESLFNPLDTKTIYIAYIKDI